MGIGWTESVLRNRRPGRGDAQASKFFLFRPRSLPGNRPSSAPEQLLKVVRQTDQVPFAAHFLQPAQQKLSESAYLFDLPEDRLDHSLAFDIGLPSALGPQLA